MTGIVILLVVIVVGIAVGSAILWNVDRKRADGVENNTDRMETDNSPNGSQEP